MSSFLYTRIQTLTETSWKKIKNFNAPPLWPSPRPALALALALGVGRRKNLVSSSGFHFPFWSLEDFPPLRLRLRLVAGFHYSLSNVVKGMIISRYRRRRLPVECRPRTFLRQNHPTTSGRMQVRQMGYIQAPTGGYSCLHSPRRFASTVSIGARYCQFGTPANVIEYKHTEKYMKLLSFMHILHNSRS